MITASNIAVIAALFAMLFFAAPIRLAITTFAPAEMPMSRLVQRTISELHTPTAPTAVSYPKALRIAVSAILKSDCATFIIIIGIVIDRSPFVIEPESISVLFFFIDNHPVLHKAKSCYIIASIDKKFYDKS